MKTAEELIGEGITSINGKPISVSAIGNILRNITYTGNTLLQKTFIQDPISKKKVMNTGELPQYFVQDTHEAIIDMDTFEQVQKKLAQNKEMGRFPYNHTGRKYPFTMKVICGCCGRHYTRQLWNTSAIGKKRPTWVCTGKKAEKYRRCGSKNIPEAKLMEASAKVLGVSEFDEDIFFDKVESITVQGVHELLFCLHGRHRGHPALGAYGTESIMDTGTKSQTRCKPHRFPGRDKRGFLHDRQNPVRALRNEL